MNAKETLKTLKDKMTEVIDTVELEEGVQIIINDDYLNSFAKGIYKEEHIPFADKISGWWYLLKVEINKLRNNQQSDVIVKINA